jgi:ferredoxin/flavodoxin---NADP+ reductase
VLGRRGPAQAAFTTPELLELSELTRADVVVDPEEVVLDEHSAAWLEREGGASARKRVEILHDYAHRPTGKAHRVELRFLRSPVEILGDAATGAVTGLRVTRNRIDAAGRAVPTGEDEVIECGLVLRSIGYRGRPLPGVPFDDRRGLIRNDGGRVTGDGGAPLPGEYAAGWVKRGPSGVIGTNKKCATETVALLLEDAAAGRLNAAADSDRDAIELWLRERVPALVTWDGWKAIDDHEVAAGEPQGRPRVKLVRVPEMLAVVERLASAA